MSPALPRRRFVSLALGAALAPCFLRGDDHRSEARRLSFYNTHTGEEVDVVYWAAGDYVKAGLTEIDRALRDHRTGEVAKMDRDLLDLLFALRQRLEAKSPFHVISGYRTPASNEHLRGRSPQSGVAKDSQHTKAKAVDIRLPGRDLDLVRDAAAAERRGGVGYYPASGFVHVDVARVRYW